MNFIIFLLIFGGAFGFFIKNGVNRKFLLIAFVVAFLLMLAQRMGGNMLIPTLGSGLNMFLMIYDILAAVTYQKKPLQWDDDKSLTETAEGEPPQGPKMPSAAEDEEYEDIEEDYQEDGEAEADTDSDSIEAEDK